MNIRRILTAIAIVSFLILAGCSSGGGGGVFEGDTGDTVGDSSGGDSSSNSDTGDNSNSPGDSSGGNTGNDGSVGGDTGSGGNTGGGDPVITGQITDGIWIGTYTINGESEKFSVVIYDNQFFGFTTMLGYEGVLTLDNTLISGDLDEFKNNGEFKATVSINGTIVENTSITGTLTPSGADFYLELDELYDKKASLSKIVGNWSIPLGTYDLDFSIDDNGELFGQDSVGCVFNGNVSVPDTEHNIYQINYVISSIHSSCDPYDGDSYTGLALLDDYETGTDNALVFTSVTTDYLNIGFLVRQ